MRLPAPMEIQYREELERIEGELQMPYVTSIERMAKQEGELQGRREDVIAVLEARFKDVPYTVCEAILHTEDEALLRRLLIQASTAESIEGFKV